MTLREIIALAGDTKSEKKRVSFQGIPITVEVSKGNSRVLHNDQGEVVYKVKMSHDYGFFNKTKGRDGDEVDVMLGPNQHATEAYVIHMVDKGPDADEREDEDKVMLGFSSASDAKDGFLRHYPANFYGGMSCIPMTEFKHKLATASLPYRRKKITARSV
jgi:hypothetical protein